MPITGSLSGIELRIGCHISLKLQFKWCGVLRCAGVFGPGGVESGGGGGSMGHYQGQGPQQG
jgi:hypothetical protein